MMKLKNLILQFPVENKNMAILKKSDILNGIRKVEACKIESMDGYMYLRPLSQAEINQVDEIEAKAMGVFETNEKAQRGRRQKPKSMVESRGKIYLDKQQKAAAQAQTKAIYLSLKNEKNTGNEEWSETDVEQMPHQVFVEVFSHVKKISGVDEDTEEDVNNFPKNK